MIIDGRATVERHGAQVRRLGRGDFVGGIDAAGRPQPSAGVTVRLETRARVLVLDPARLAVLIKAEPALAAAWRSLIDGPARDDGTATADKPGARAADGPAGSAGPGYETEATAG